MLVEFNVKQKLPDEYERFDLKTPIFQFITYDTDGNVQRAQISTGADNEFYKNITFVLPSVFHENGNIAVMPMFRRPTSTYEVQIKFKYVFEDYAQTVAGDHTLTATTITPTFIDDITPAEPETQEEP